MLHRIVALALFASGAALAQAPATPAAKLPFTIERSWEIQRLGAPVISPDGRRIVAPVTRFVMSEDKGYTDLWIWNRDGSGERAFTTHASNEGSPAFSPDGRFLAFVAQREDDKAPQLYVMPLDGGEARRLTRLATGVQSPKWFPDGRRIAFVSRVFADLPLSEQGKRLEERANPKMTGQVWDGAPVTAWDRYIDERQKWAEFYARELRDLPWLRTPSVPAGSRHGSPKNSTMGPRLPRSRSASRVTRAASRSIRSAKHGW